MKKYSRYIVCCGALLFCLHTNAQIYTQDADGKSTIIAPGSSINFDISKEALSINWNNWQNLALDKKTFWGIAAKGKNEEGITNLFSEGNFVPTTRMSGFVAFKKVLDGGERSKYETAIKLKRGAIVAKEKEILKLLDIQDLGKKMIEADDEISQIEKQKLTAEFLKLFVTIPSNTEGYITIINEAIKAEEKKEPVNELKVNIYKAIVKQSLSNITQSNKVTTEYTELEESLFHLQNMYQEYRNNTVDKNFLFYINGGVNAAQFRLYDESVPGTLGDRIIKTPYTTGFIDLGINYDIGARWLIGASVGYEKYSTFDSLTDKQSVLRTTTVVGNQTLIQDKSYTTYTGDFYKYDRVSIKFDVMRFGKLGDEARYAWNMLYGRIWAPFGSIKPKGIINLGTAFNFHKKNGKFIGGLYCEAVDIGNNMGADTKFPQRLNLGIVATFSFNSILGHY